MLMQPVHYNLGLLHSVQGTIVEMPLLYATPDSF
jgi:hypothetical protein